MLTVILEVLQTPLRVPNNSRYDFRGFIRSRNSMCAGEHHVFRFNNPEEVRKLRDRATARSSLRMSVTAAELEGDGQGTPITRPDSPSSADMEDVDWNYAKREAALTRLGLDPALDNLPDEDLNKLYEKISKVKTLRDINSRRPESSLSQADDVWSETGKPMPSEVMTDDTSVDAGPSHGSPDLDHSLQSAQNQLENQKADFESRLMALSDGGSSEAEDLKAEKEQMEAQLKLVQVQMKRILEAKARGASTVDLEPVEPVIYTAKQLRLIRKTLDRWRAHRSFSMAEVVLSNAVALKEANVIRLGTIFYNFINALMISIVRNLPRMFPITSQLLREVLWQRQDLRSWLLLV